MFDSSLSNSVARAEKFLANPPAETSQTRVCDGFVLRLDQDLSSFASLWPGMLEMGGAFPPQCHAFQCRDHLEIWLRTIGQESKIKPLFVSISDRAGNCMMLVPLGIERKRGLKILKFLDGGVADYNAPVLFPAAAGLTRTQFLTLWRSLCELLPSFDFAAFEKVPERVGDLWNPFHALTQEPWPMSGHYMTLEPEADIAALSPDIKESRRKRRRLEEMGPLSFHLAVEPEEIDRVFEIFVKQKSRRYMETLGFPGFDVPGQKAYYLELTRRFPPTCVQLAYLSAGGNVIATAWNLVAGGRLYYLMSGYEDGEWRKYSPSALLTEEMISWSCRNGLKIFDFGIGDEAYKFRWARHELPLWGGIHCRTALGKAYCAGMWHYRSLKKALPPGVVSFAKMVRDGIKASRGPALKTAPVPSAAAGREMPISPKES